MSDKQNKNKTWETMTFAECGEYIQQVEESVRQYGNKDILSDAGNRNKNGGYSGA